MELSKKRILGILVLGIGASFAFFFILQVFAAKIIVDFIMGYLGNEAMLFLIILGFEGIVLVVSVAVGLMLSGPVKLVMVYKATLMSFLSNLIFLIVLSYVSMIVMYPEVFSEVEGPEIIFIFPSVLVYFSIYVLGQVFYLFYLSIISYYAFFIIFMKVFYEYESRYKSR